MVLEWLSPDKNIISKVDLDVRVSSFLDSHFWGYDGESAISAHPRLSLLALLMRFPLRGCEFPPPFCVVWMLGRDCLPFELPNAPLEDADALVPDIAPFMD